MNPIYFRVLAYLALMVLLWMIAATLSRTRVLILILSVVFGILGMAAFLKGIGLYNESVLVFDYGMSAYLVFAIPYLAFTFRRVGSAPSGHNGADNA